MIRVLLVDDHDIVRLGLSTYLETVDDIEVVGEASNGQMAVDLARRLQPDVILMDLLMPVKSGVEAIRELSASGCTSRIVVLTSTVDDKSVLEAVRAGALSYILKTSPPHELTTVIRQASQGLPTLDSKAQKTLMGQVQAQNERELWQDLTDRELDVLRAIGTGKNNQEIADSLGIGIKTVKTHVSNVLLKLCVQDRTQAAIYAIRKELV
ncbi:response regulator [Alicyclobacillus dauci]|uniref:Response regulator transcription factor n=1 Tax=Alicyclobacillus dauci TaxID=1475485 RepID=A0ABY6Z5I8_9BACL|nr:response regulator transcription factor [Alicyclobacillus dauci]WAH37788.1 response regulator transcription factor [Alicyclobacillus dauci]